jgi:hypothetical protein
MDRRYRNIFKNATAVFDIFLYYHFYDVRDKWVPVLMAWRVLRLWMEKRPPDMEGSCEYIE